MRDYHEIQDVFFAAEIRWYSVDIGLIRSWLVLLRFYSAGVGKIDKIPMKCN